MEEDDLEIINSSPTIQKHSLQAPGAPVEEVNPLGHEVTLLSATMLNVGRIVGSGIYAVPGVILHSVGSVGMLLMLWIIVPFFAYAGIVLYCELAAMFPKRSGGEVVYMEQMFPKPKFLIPTSFAFCAFLLSINAANAVIFAQYFLTSFEIPITDAGQIVAAVAVVFIATACVVLSTKWSLRIVNLLTMLKTISLVFIVITGTAVLLGLTRIRDPIANFHNLFAHTSTNFNALANAMVKVNWSFVGWNNAFYMLAEIKGPNPIHTVRKASIISLALTATLFLLINVAYVAAVPPEEICNSGQLVAALFFKRVFGNTTMSKLFPLLVALSCFGNIIAVTVPQARMLREVARQGLLPFPRLFATTIPFGTPIGPVILSSMLTFFVIFALPAKDSFNFILDVTSYPRLIFQVIMCFGIWGLRKTRANTGLPLSGFEAKNVFILIFLFESLFLTLMPWVPPEPGQADVSFWYATYCVVGVAILVACGIYYWLWIILLPRLGRYEIIEELEEQSNGARNVRLVRQYLHEGTEHQPLLSTVT